MAQKVKQALVSLTCLVGIALSLDFFPGSKFSYTPLSVIVERRKRS